MQGSNYDDEEDLAEPAIMSRGSTL